MLRQCEIWLPLVNTLEISRTPGFFDCNLGEQSWQSHFGIYCDAIENEGNTCLWCNARFLIKDHAIPKELSIHLFVNTTAKKIWSDEVRSMIIQLSGSPESYEESCEFLKFIFSKVSFKNLKCLMFCGIELSTDFSQEIGALNLDVFHMRNFSYHINRTLGEFFRYCNSLKTLYVVHPYEDMHVYLPKELKKLAIYCPKSSKDIIRRRKVIYTGLSINVDKCHALRKCKCFCPFHIQIDSPIPLFLDH